MRVSHQANKDVHYDPETDRQEDMFLAANITLTKAFWPPGSQPTPVSLGTSDPRFRSLRELWSAAVPALKRYPPKVPELQFPPFPNLSKESFCTALKGWNKWWSGPLSGNPMQLAPYELLYVVAYNFNKQLFGTEFSKDEIDMIAELFEKFGSLPQLQLAGPLPEAFAKRGFEIQTKLVDAIIERSEGFAASFMAEAEKRGYNGKEAMAGLFLPMVIAGMSSPGTTFFVMHSIDQLKEDIKTMVPLYKKDPEAFNLEVVRLNGAGGANTNFHAKKTTQWKLPSGRVITEREGTYAMTNTKLAGYDPAVWGGPTMDPEYAAKFIPGRDNRERVIPWMSELQDIRKCPNMTGCEAAPRFCPGAELTLRLTRQVVDFYIETCVEGASGRDEL
jgi:hypothetical protein